MRIITDIGCSEATKYHINTLGMSTGYDHDVARCTKVAGRDAMFAGHPHGTMTFNAVLGSSLTPAHPDILRICPHCTETHKNMYYQHLTAVPDGFDVLNNIMRYYNNGTPTGNK